DSTWPWVTIVAWTTNTPTLEPSSVTVRLDSIFPETSVVNPLHSACPVNVAPTVGGHGGAGIGSGKLHVKVVFWPPMRTRKTICSTPTRLGSNRRVVSISLFSSSTRCQRWVSGAVAVTAIVPSEGTWLSVVAKCVCPDCQYVYVPVRGGLGDACGDTGAAVGTGPED